MAIIGEIRKHSGIAVAIVGIAIAAFIIGDLTKNGNKQPDLGSIDGEEITYAHFNALTTQKEEIVKKQQQSDQITTEQSYQIREEVWRELVENKLNQKQYDKLGLQVTQRELSDMYMGDFIHPYLRQVFTDPSTGVYNTQIIAQYVNNFDQLQPEQQTEWIELEKYVKTSRQQEKYNLLIAKSFYTPKVMTDKILEIESRTSDVRVAALPYNMVSEDQITLTDEDYKKYYDAHKKQYKQDDARDLDYIIFPVMPSASDLNAIQSGVAKTWEEFQTITSEEVEVFVNSESEHNKRYDSTFVKASSFAAPFDSLIRNASVGQFIEPRIVGNQWMMTKIQKIENRPDSIRASVIVLLNNKLSSEIARTPAQAKALTDSLERELKAGKLDFTQAVMTYSDDPSKKDNQGDMGWALDGNYGLLNEKMITTDVNGVFVFERPDKGGYHIVKVTGKTAPSKKYQVATIVRDIVPSDATSRSVYEKANQFASENRTHEAMLSAAQNNNLMIRNADFTPAMANRLPGVENARSIIQWAFKEDTKKGEVAPQVFETDDVYIVVALKEIREKGYATLEQVKSYIENQVRIEKKAEILMKKAEDAMKNTKDVATIASQLAVPVDSIARVSFGSYTFGKFGPEMTALGTIAAVKQPKLLAPIKGVNGVYVIQVDNVIMQPAVNPQNLIQSMEMENQQKVRYIMEVLKENTKIKDNRVLFF